MSAGHPGMHDVGKDVVFRGEGHQPVLCSGRSVSLHDEKASAPQ
jgi:hypothetical protein